MIGAFFILTFNLLSTNFNGLVSNNWSIANESLYATLRGIVVSQINPRSGLVYFPIIYALFLFIFINNFIGLVNWCLYIFLLIKFIFIVLRIIKKGNIIRTYFLFTSFSTYSTSHKPNPSNKNSYYLHPYYITGFADGEGCFTTSIFKDSRRLTGWQVKPVFKINLHKRDLKILEAIQRTLGVGKIYHCTGGNAVEYRVSSLKNLRVIVNHFDKYPLITQKLADYLLFQQSIALIENKEHLTKGGLLKLLGIKASLNLGLSEKFRESFPNIVPAVRPIVKPTEIKNANWFRGFVEAEGCFQIIIQESAKARGLRFSLSQHYRDSELLQSFVNYLGCGRLYRSSTRNDVNFIVSVFSDINDKIIPFFKEYPLIGVKKENFEDFLKVAELIRSKEHLTKEGLDKMKRIQSNMNSKRIDSLIEDK